MFLLLLFILQQIITRSIARHKNIKLSIFCILISISHPAFVKRNKKKLNPDKKKRIDKIVLVGGFYL